MKKIKQTNILIILLILFSTCKTIAQPVETLIIGSWVADGSSIGNKWVFNTNGTLQEYTDNLLSIEYNWTITTITSSGVVSYYLKIVNISDSNDFYNYEINAINDERLVLIYQRGNNMGIGKPAIYIRQ